MNKYIYSQFKEKMNEMGLDKKDPQFHAYKEQLKEFLWYLRKNRGEVRMYLQQSMQYVVDGRYGRKGQENDLAPFDGQPHRVASESEFTLRNMTLRWHPATFHVAKEVFSITSMPQDSYSIIHPQWTIGGLLFQEVFG